MTESQTEWLDWLKEQCKTCQEQRHLTLSQRLKRAFRQLRLARTLQGRYR